MANVLSLFSGCGGAVEGFTQAGHTVVAAVDYDEYCIETLKANHEDVAVIQADLSELSPSDFAKQYDIQPSEIDIVVGGPPCQGFSNSGNMDVDDARNTLVFRFADYVEYYQPESFVMENVVGMLSFEEIFTALLSTFEEQGYTVQHDVHNSKNYGVPQKRRRVLICGSMNGSVLTDTSQYQEKTVGDVFHDLPILQSGEQSDCVLNHKAPNHQQKTIERIDSTEQGEPMYDSWNDDIRLAEDAVAPTLKAKNFQFSHPTQNRGITVRERARLQTFPDDYEICGTLTAQRRQVGNAVPVKMMKAIADEL